MSRRDRRKLQAQLGLNKFYKKETREKKLERWLENQENGKRIHEETKERVKLIQNMSAEEIESAKIAVLAQKISEKKQIPLVDALEEAQIKFRKK